MNKWKTTQSEILPLTERMENLRQKERLRGAMTTRIPVPGFWGTCLMGQYQTLEFSYWKPYPSASLIAQLVKNPPAMQETPIDSWVGKIHWRRDRLPTAVFLGFPHGWAVKNLPAVRKTWVQSLCRNPVSLVCMPVLLFLQWYLTWKPVTLSHCLLCSYFLAGAKGIL